MKKINILVIGYLGVEGSQVYKTFLNGKYNNFITVNGYDISNSLNEDSLKNQKFDFTFICVPTDSKNGQCDTSIVESAIDKWYGNSGIIIIKSTVYPGFTDSITKKYPNVIFSPHFVGDTPSSDFDEDFVILGGNSKLTHKVSQLYETIHSGYFKVIQCRSTEAELSKYFENCILAAKVVFCNYFKLACDSMGVDYDIVRQLSLNDKRISPSHTIVFDDNLGYNSKCFNKDVEAVSNVNKIDENFSDFIHSLIRYNYKLLELNK